MRYLDTEAQQHEIYLQNELATNEGRYEQGIKEGKIEI